MEVSHSNTVWRGYGKQLYAEYSIGAGNMGNNLKNSSLERKSHACEYLMHIRHDECMHHAH